MKTASLIVTGIVLFASIAFARQPVTITGTLVDNACRLEGMTKEQLAKHDRGCLQMGVCAKSGYAIVTEDGKAFLLDAKSNSLAVAAIKKSGRKTDMKATVVGLIKGDSVTANSVVIEPAPALQAP